MEDIPAHDVPGRGRLHRSATDRIFAGVAGGLGDALNFDPTLIRLGWILFTLVGGSGVLAYLVAWAIIPDEDGRRTMTPVAILLLLFAIPCCCAALGIFFSVIGEA